MDQASRIFLALWVLPICAGVATATVAALIGLARGDRLLNRVYTASRAARAYCTPGLGVRAPGVSIRTPAEFAAWRHNRDSLLATLPASDRPSHSRLTPDVDAMTAWAHSNGLRVPGEGAATVVDAAPSGALYVEPARSGMVRGLNPGESVDTWHDSSPDLASVFCAPEGYALDLCLRTVAGVGPGTLGERTADPRYVASPVQRTYYTAAYPMHDRGRYQTPVTVTLAYCGGWNRRSVA